MAIAFDTSTDGLGTTGTSLTYAHTCTGANGALFVYVLDYPDDFVTGVTYAGAAMTLIRKNTTGSVTIYLYGLLNPATGSNNIVISASGSTGLDSLAASYTGVKQTGLPDGSNDADFLSQSSGVNVTTSVTTTADNCWGIYVMWKTNNVNSPVAQSNSTLRKSVRGQGLFDTNGPKTPAGSLSMSVNQTDGTQIWGTIMATFAPATASAATRSNSLMMGV